jgi:hypothetical protein
MTKLLVPSFATAILGKKHRWSGWPGAYCIDCGCPDPMEEALSDLKPDEDVEKIYEKLVITECPIEKVIYAKE